MFKKQPFLLSRNVLIVFQGSNAHTAQKRKSAG